MRLSELEPQLYRYIGDKTFKPVTTVVRADCVMFLCPKCFTANNGPVGTHSIRVDFAGKGVPEDVCIHNAEGKDVWWNVTGKDVSDITLTPSIQLIGGCAWHGFVTAGGIVHA